MAARKKKTSRKAAPKRKVAKKTKKKKVAKKGSRRKTTKKKVVRRKTPRRKKQSKPAEPGELTETREEIDLEETLPEGGLPRSEDPLEETLTEGCIPLDDSGLADSQLEATEPQTDSPEEASGDSQDSRAASRTTHSAFRQKIPIHRGESSSGAAPSSEHKRERDEEGELVDDEVTRTELFDADEAFAEPGDLDETLVDVPENLRVEPDEPAETPSPKRDEPVEVSEGEEPFGADEATMTEFFADSAALSAAGGGDEPPSDRPVPTPEPEDEHEETDATDTHGEDERVLEETVAETPEPDEPVEISEGDEPLGADEATMTEFFTDSAALSAAGGGDEPPEDERVLEETAAEAPEPDEPVEVSEGEEPLADEATMTEFFVDSVALSAFGAGAPVPTPEPEEREDETDVTRDDDLKETALDTDDTTEPFERPEESEEEDEGTDSWELGIETPTMEELGRGFGGLLPPDEPEDSEPEPAGDVLEETESLPSASETDEPESEELHTADDLERLDDSVDDLDEGSVTGTDPAIGEPVVREHDEEEELEDARPRAPREEGPTETEIIEGELDPATIKLPTEGVPRRADESALSFTEESDSVEDPEATKTEASDRHIVVFGGDAPDEETEEASDTHAAPTIHDVSTADAAMTAHTRALPPDDDDEPTDIDALGADALDAAIRDGDGGILRDMAPVAEFVPFEPVEQGEEEEEAEIAPKVSRIDRLHRRRAPSRLVRVLAVVLQGVLGRFKPHARQAWETTRRTVRGWLQAIKGTQWDQPVKWWKSQPRVRSIGEPGWWRRTLIEVAIAYGILLPFELLINGRVGAYGAYPHPYWLIVIPMAAARGAAAGMVAAGVGSLLYVLSALGTLGFTELRAMLDYRTLLDPLLFFAVGFVVGDFRDVMKARLRELKRDKKETEETAERLRKERDVLAEANRLLEKRLVDQTTQFGNLVVAAQRMESADRTEVFELALDLVEEHCGASGSVLLVLDNGSVDFLCYRGFTEVEVGERLRSARTSSFVQRALSEGANVDGFASDESPPEKGPIAVAPLVDRSGVVKALLCLDEIPPYRLNNNTLQIFYGIGEWISAALQRMERRTEAPDPREAFPVAPEAEAWVGDPEDLGERLRLEYERLARYGVPTSLITIHAGEWTDNTPEGRKKLDRYMLTHFTGGIRASDTLYRFGYPGCYVLVLGGTNPEGAEVVRKRLDRRVRYRPSPVVGKVAMEVTAPDAEAPDLVSLATKIAKRFREFSPLNLDRDSPVKIPSAPRLATLEEFVRRIKIETSLALRGGLDLHVVGLFAEDEVGGDPDLFARHVQDVAAGILRNTDAVFRITPGRCAVLLPATDATHSETIGRRLVEGVRKRDPDAAYGEVRCRVFGLGPAYPDADAFLAAFDDDAVAAAEEDADAGDDEEAVVRERSEREETDEA